MVSCCLPMWKEGKNRTNTQTASIGKHHKRLNHLFSPPPLGAVCQTRKVCPRTPPTQPYAHPLGLWSSSGSHSSNINSHGSDTHHVYSICKCMDITAQEVYPPGYLQNQGKGMVLLFWSDMLLLQQSTSGRQQARYVFTEADNTVNQQVTKMNQSTFDPSDFCSQIRTLVTDCLLDHEKSGQ